MPGLTRGFSDQFETSASSNSASLPGSTRISRITVTGGSVSSERRKSSVGGATRAHIWPSPARGDEQPSDQRRVLRGSWRAAGRAPAGFARQKGWAARSRERRSREGERSEQPRFAEEQRGNRGELEQPAGSDQGTGAPRRARWGARRPRARGPRDLVHDAEAVREKDQRQEQEPDPARVEMEIRGHDHLSALTTLNSC